VTDGEQEKQREVRTRTAALNGTAMRAQWACVVGGHLQAACGLRICVPGSTIVLIIVIVLLLLFVIIIVHSKPSLPTTHTRT
jgi:hypothetical protein